MHTSPPQGAEALTADDQQWARDLANSMVTAALAMIEAEDMAETDAIFAAVRSAALDVRTDDGLSAERWMLAMWFLAARSAGLLSRIAAHEDVPAEAAWQAMVLHAAR